MNNKKVVMELLLIESIRNFIEYEARSCSMDFGCITPLYVYRMCGGQVPLNEIEVALANVRKMM